MINFFLPIESENFPITGPKRKIVKAEIEKKYVIWERVHHPSLSIKEKK